MFQYAIKIRVVRSIILLDYYPDFPTLALRHSGSDQVDTQPVETLELEQRASVLASEKSPGVPETSTRADSDVWEKIKHQKTLVLGEPIPEDDEDGTAKGMLPKSKTLDYTQLAKEVGGFKIVSVLYLNCSKLFPFFILIVLVTFKSQV